jgi:hypothetical protein
MIDKEGNFKKETFGTAYSYSATRTQEIVLKKGDRFIGIEGIC